MWKLMALVVITLNPVDVTSDSFGTFVTYTECQTKQIEMIANLQEPVLSGHMAFVCVKL